MRRIWLVFWHEYWRNVKRRSYLIFTFGFPLFVTVGPVVGGLLLALAIFMAMPPTDTRPIGLVDEAGLLAGIESYPDEPVPALPFESGAEAEAALAGGEIQGYYVIQPDYWQSGEVRAVYETAPTEPVDQMVERLIAGQVRAAAPAELLQRLDRGPDIVHQGLTEERAFSAADMVEPVIVYMLVYFVRLAGTFTASYMFDSIASEADDRTLEILITSVSPFEFVTGKLLGLLAVGLTQLGMWGGTLLVLVVGAGFFLEANLLALFLAWEHLWLLVSLLLGTYVLDQILAAAMGMFRVSGGAGNMFFNVINMVVGIGLLYAAYFVPRNPHTPLAIGASLFPLTAPLVLPIRVVVSQVPRWQVIGGQVILWTTCALSLLLLRRLLRVNLVAYAPAFSLAGWIKARVRR